MNPLDFDNSMLWDSALDQRDAIEPLPAVYALLHQAPFGRLRGESNILYIGSTGQLGGRSDRCRLRIYRYPNGAHANALRARTQQLVDFGVEVTLRWHYLQTRTEARAMESRILQEYLQEYCELPPFNSRC